MHASLTAGGDLGSYSAGFRGGAEALIEVLESRQYGQDVLVYPIVYCLRHAVELALKQVTWAGRRLLDVRDDFPDGHNLDTLWTHCRPVLKAIWPREDDDSFSHVEETVRSLSVIDPAGEGFRYPVGTKKKGRSATLDPDLQELDLAKLFADVEETLSLLDGADTGIDVYSEAKADMVSEAREYEAELRAEYGHEGP